MALLRDLLSWKHGLQRITATAALTHEYVAALSTGREPDWVGSFSAPFDEKVQRSAKAYRSQLYKSAGVDAVLGGAPAAGAAA